MEPTTVKILILLGPLLAMTAAQQVKMNNAKIFIFLFIRINIEMNDALKHTVGEFIRLYFNAVMLLFFIFHYALYIFCEFVVSGCDASENDWGCCTDSVPCALGEGDCDNDSQCSGALVCGTDNCKNFDSAWSSSSWDCCTTGKNKKCKKYLSIPLFKSI